MAGPKIDSDYIVELFAAFGPVSVRRMFGGAGIFADGCMFGLVADGTIYLKADAATIPEFEREHSAPFSYVTRHGTHALKSYWRLPERLYDDPEELARWAVAAHAVARAGAASKTRKVSGAQRNAKVRSAADRRSKK